MQLPTQTKDIRLLRRQLLARIDGLKLEKDRGRADATRARCEASFAEFVKAAWHVIEPGTTLRWNWHLQAMCDHLQAISDGTLTPWLIINVPPGSSKSTIVSVLWQAWEWGPRGQRHLRYVSTSFEEGNVKRDTRKCRDLIRSDWFTMLWPEVSLVRFGETSFANDATGSREGVTFSAVTGKRGDRVVIDDPHSLKGAESEADRTRTVREFMEGGLNRTNDALKSAMVIVMQRLHQNDLTGALLAAELGFVHLMIPMEFEVERRCTTPLMVDGIDETGAKVRKNWTDPRSYEGQLMDPTRFPREAVDRQKKAGVYAWAGQYQQRPAPRSGGLFRIKENWQEAASEGGMIVESPPAGGHVVGGWDFAGSKRKTSPYSVRVKMLRAPGGSIYILHVERKRTTPAELEAMVVETTVNDGHHVRQDMPQDPGQAGKAQAHRLAELIEGFDFRISVETGDKETRANPFAAQVEVGKVFLVRGDWNAAFIEELRGFPTGSYKDQVDACSRAYAALVGRPSETMNAAPEVIDLSSSDPTDPRERLKVRSGPASTRAQQVDAWGA